MNDKLARMQHEKIELAQKGNEDDTLRASQWISNAMERVSTAAEMTLVSDELGREISNRMSNSFLFRLTISPCALLCLRGHVHREKMVS